MYTTKAFNRGNDARQILSYGLSDLAAADRQTVEERLSGGQSLEDAATEFLTDDYILKPGTRIRSNSFRLLRDDTVNFHIFGKDRFLL